MMNDEEKFDIARLMHHTVKKPKSQEYYDLHVYKKCIDLLKQLLASTQKSPNYVKFGMIQDLQKELLNIASEICYAANSKQNKVNFLKNAYKQAKHLQVCVRVLLDINAITKKGFYAISTLSEDVVRQLQGWLKSEINKQKAETSQNPQ